jgi:hypothetical protein
VIPSPTFLRLDLRRAPSTDLRTVDLRKQRALIGPWCAAVTWHDPETGAGAPA